MCVCAATKLLYSAPPVTLPSPTELRNVPPMLRFDFAAAVDDALANADGFPRQSVLSMEM